MITVNVEKEVRQENKVIKSFTVRQVLFIVAALLAAGLFYLIARPGVSTAMGFGSCMGVLAWYFGFHKKNGLPVEYFLWKRIKTAILMNYQRKYRTRNMYITMLNDAYEADRLSDMQDKKKARAVKQRIKKQKKKRSKLRGFR